MKVRRACPKCNGSDILRVEGKAGAYGSGNNIITGMTIFSAVLAHRYVCWTVPGAKNMLFGGEGIFNTVLTGPGRVWLQTMPIYNVANAIRPYIPTSSN